MDEKRSWSVRQKSIKELCLFLSLLKSGISVDRIRRAQGKGENFSSPVCWCMVVVCVCMDKQTRVVREMGRVWSGFKACLKADMPVVLVVATCQWSKE